MPALERRSRAGYAAKVPLVYAAYLGPTAWRPLLSFVYDVVGRQGSTETVFSWFIESVLLCVSGRLMKDHITYNKANETQTENKNETKSLFRLSPAHAWARPPRAELAVRQELEAPVRVLHVIIAPRGNQKRDLDAMFLIPSAHFSEGGGNRVATPRPNPLVIPWLWQRALASRLHGERGGLLLRVLLLTEHEPRPRRI